MANWEQAAVGPDQEQESALLEATLQDLSSSDSPSLQQQADEILAISAILEDSSITLYHPPLSSHSLANHQNGYGPPKAVNNTLHLLLKTTTSESQRYPLNLILSLPPDYPTASPPLIQLQNQFVGPHSVTPELFAQVLRTFMHEPVPPEALSAAHRSNNHGHGNEGGAGALVSAGVGGGVPWMPLEPVGEGQVCLFEGIENVRERVAAWVDVKDEEKQKLEVIRAGVGQYSIGGSSIGGPVAAVKGGENGEGDNTASSSRSATPPPSSRAQAPSPPTIPCPTITSSQPVVDRKSVFIGHAAAVKSIDEVHAVMANLLSDKKIAKASHNISAYRFTSTDGILHQDNDDDGESAAGSRLAHLLSLMGVENIVVVVTRWYGGIHLGSDRFRLINQAAREAVEAAGFLNPPAAESGKGGGGKKGGKKK